MKFKLTNKQAQFVGAFEQFPTYIGAIGTGKSTALIVKALFHSQESKNNLGIIVRKNYTDLRDSTIKDFELYTGFKVNEQKKECILPNGSTILFRHCDELPVLKNLNLGLAGIEQCDELPDETTYEFLKMRLRRDVKFRTCFMVGNTSGHNWVWRMFKDSLPDNHLLIEATTIEHAKYLPPDYIKNLETLPKKLYNRYVMNSWEESEGLVYDEYLESRDVIEPFSIPEGWEKGFVLDHGYRNPTAVNWYAIDYDGNIFCVAPETKILTENLTWVRADEVQENDTLAGFDEQSSDGTKRHWKSAVVEGIRKVIKPSYKITLSDGTTIKCSSDHQWLVDDSGGRREWRKTENIKIGWKLNRVTDVWDRDKSFESGYLAGVFDGEGSLVKNKSNRFSLSFTQRDNIVLSKVKSELDNLGLRYGIYENKQNDCLSLQITRKKDIIKFLGSIRPERLLLKFKVDFLGGFSSFSQPTVVKKEFLGNIEVVAIQTSSKTYIAEGLASHNCYQEHYEAEKPVSHHSDSIKRLGEQREGIADPSIFSLTQQRNGYIISIADEYREFGINLRPSMRSKEDASVARVNEFFKAGRIKIFKNCVNTIREIGNWKWKSVRPQVVQLNKTEEPEDKDNHTCDNLKYLITSRFGAAVKVEPIPEKKRHTIYSIEQGLEQEVEEVA